MDGQKQAITEAVGLRIRCFRRMRNLSQEEIALRANLSPAYFGQVERGLKCPTIDTLYRIAMALETSLSELLRMDTTSGGQEKRHDRLQAILERVPPNKEDQFCRIMEEILDMIS